MSLHARALKPRTSTAEPMAPCGVPSAVVATACAATCGGAELEAVGKPKDALDFLFTFLTSKHGNRPFQKSYQDVMMKFLELTVRQRASKEARDGLQEYKKLTEKVRPRSRCLPTHDGAAVACDERWNGGVTPLGDRAWHGTRGVRTWVGGSHRGRSPHWGDALPRSPPPGCALTSSWRSLGVAVGTRVLCDRRSAAGGDDDQQGEGGRRRAACCRGICQRGRHRKCWRSGGSAPPPPSVSPLCLRARDID